MDGRDGWVAPHCHLPTNWPNSTAWRASKAANQRPCQQPPASTLIFLPPHLPPLSLHPVMRPELSQLRCHSRAVTDPRDWRRWQAVTRQGARPGWWGRHPGPLAVQSGHWGGSAPLCPALWGGKLAGVLSGVHCYGILFSCNFIFSWLSRIVLVKTAIKKLKSNVLAQRSRSISLLKICNTGARIVLGTQRAPFISRVQVTLQALMN